MAAKGVEHELPEVLIVCILLASLQTQVVPFISHFLLYHRLDNDISCLSLVLKATWH